MRVCKNGTTGRAMLVEAVSALMVLFGIASGGAWAQPAEGLGKKVDPQPVTPKWRSTVDVLRTKFHCIFQDRDPMDQ